jgi:hypothetical protein
LSFALIFPSNYLTNFTITPSNSAIASATVQAAGSSRPIFTVAAQAGQAMNSSLLGTIGFTALANDSAFLAVSATNLGAIQSNGTNVGRVTVLPGQIVVIGAHPLLAPALSSNSMITLTLYGNPGTNYGLAYTTNLASTNWQVGSSILLTNLQQSVNVPATAPHMYYRLQ